MPQPPDSFWLQVFVDALALAILAAWILIIYRWRRYGSILPYEPRRPVPWGPVGGLLACAFVLNALMAAAMGTAPAPNAGMPDAPTPLPPISAPSNAVGQMVLMIFTFPLLVGGVLAAIAIYSQATQRDLGLPEYVPEFARDVGLGLVAFFAALVPVYGVLSLLIAVFGEPSHHQLVDTVLTEKNGLVTFLATVSAVIVAPICEEITFRLLLQGWLEKWEDGGQLTNDEQMTNDEIRMTNDKEIANDEVRMANEVGTAVDNSSFVIRHSSFPFRLPHGWMPILVSSLLFALAHVGQGSAPIALFFLAIGLGYLYQRTHRIVPSIFTHAAFNLLTMIALELSIKAASP